MSGATAATREITFRLRIDDQNPGHTRVSVFAGRNPGARGLSGRLVFRNEEWELFRRMVESFPKLLEAVRAMERNPRPGARWVYCSLCAITAEPDASIVHEEGCLIGDALRAAEGVAA